MVSKVLKEVMERMQEWPEERRETAAQVLMAMEQDEGIDYRLTDEQVAEVERRRASPNRTFIPLEEVRAYFAKRRA